MNKITSYLPLENYKGTSNVAKAAGVLNGLVSAEMAIRALGNIFLLIRSPGNLVLKQALSFNLGGALYFGLSALNTLPGSSLFSGTVFSIHAFFTGNAPDAYWVAQGFHRVVIPVWNSVISPVFSKVFEITIYVLEALAMPIHPIWSLTGFLLVAIVAYKVVLPQFVGSN